MFKLILTDLQEGLVTEWREKFEEFPEVEIHCGKFEDIEFDCVVSAANSFGMMDGGVDGAISSYFGWHVMRRVHDVLLRDFLGEQPVGTSIIVLGNENAEETGNKYVAHTPTMRIPENINGTDNAYRAMKAMLLAVKKHNDNYDSLKLHVDAGLQPKSDLIGFSKINSVVCVGLGTFCGDLPFDKAASQMAMAYRHFKNPPLAVNWTLAQNRTIDINGVR